MIRRKFLYALGAASPFLPASSFASFFNRTEEAGIVIVGAGGAGLAAAARASELYKGKIIVLEKQSKIGGNTLISGGYLGVVDPKRQTPLQIIDSEEKHFQDIYVKGDCRGDPELIRTLVKNAPRMLKWIESQGVQFQNSVIEIYGSHFPRCHIPSLPNGLGYINTLSEKAMERGAEIRKNCQVTALIRDKSGRLSGLQYLDANNKLVTLRVKNAVILSGGGFGSNPDLVTKYDPRLSRLTHNTGPGSTGELLLAAEKVGCELIQMENIQCLPGVHPTGKIRVRFHNDVSRFILVNSEGNRFTDEGARRDLLKEAVLAQPGKMCFSVIDNDGFESYDLLMRRDAIRGIETGDAFKGETLDELALKMGVPGENLKNAVNAYNKAIEGTVNHPIIQPPFWAARTSMSIHYTMGGLKINSRAQCLDAQGEVISGLYAAGECTGGIHGNNRIGGNGICDALTYGMIAAESAISTN